MSRAWRRGGHVDALFVLLPDVALHGTVDLVDIDGYLCLEAAWIVHFVGLGIADTLHVLGVSVLLVDGAPLSYIDLGIVPLVHAQRLDFGDMCSQLAVQGCASHAQEDAQLGRVSVSVFLGRVGRVKVVGGHTLQLAHPAWLSAGSS